MQSVYSVQAFGQSKLIPAARPARLKVTAAARKKLRVAPRGAPPPPAPVRFDIPAPSPPPPTWSSPPPPSYTPPPPPPPSYAPPSPSYTPPTPFSPEPPLSVASPLRRGACGHPLQRVVPPVLPTVYVYDHCPYCVRVRLALGLKNVKHNVVYMMNDDVDTPTQMLGKKIAPILEIPGPNGVVMGESMDIVRFFDDNPAYGPTGIIRPPSGRKDISAWQKSVKPTLALLHRPRYMLAGLPEFSQRDSRDYFISGHQLPPYEKAVWKAELSAAEKQRKYDEAYARTAELLPELNQALVQLEQLIYSQDCCTEGGVCMDDIDLWARLRSITLVKGAKFGPKTMAYLQNMADLADCTLYFSMAC